jgi:hypothetical protein
VFRVINRDHTQIVMEHGVRLQVSHEQSCLKDAIVDAHFIDAFAFACVWSGFIQLLRLVEAYLIRIQGTDIPSGAPWQFSADK